MGSDMTKAGLEMTDITKRIRMLVRRLLEREVPAQDVTFALAYIATELGLVLGNDAAKVFPVVLSGASQAASDFLVAQQHEAGGDELLERAPAGAPIH